MLRLFLAIAIAIALRHISAQAANASVCNRTCGSDEVVPYPFGFTEGCPIRLNCSDLGNGESEVEIGGFLVRNVTSESLLVDVPPDCRRPIGPIIHSLFGSNYAMTWKNVPLVTNCIRPASASACNIPTALLSQHFDLGSCGPRSENVSCLTAGATNGFLNATNISASGCASLFTFIGYVNGQKPYLPSLTFRTVELGWWLEGECLCSPGPGAYCTNVTSPVTGKPGYRCSCVNGFEGDGFQNGDGCRRGTSPLLSAGPIIAGVLVGGVIVGTSSIFLGFLLIRLYLCRAKKTHNQIIAWKSSKRPPSIESFLEKNESLSPKRYRYSDVKKMTKSFSDKLGQGGYGVVYMGRLHDGHYVAVKVLSSSKGNGEEFVNEVGSIGRTSHVNVVRLVGFCYEGSKRALIYEFMPNGSLEKFIYSERSETIPLGWERLFNIAVGIARGLEYLHCGCNTNTRIVHFDIKPHNILLDQDFCPKISDFGLSKLCRPKESIISMCGARGTPGYIAPEILSRDFGAISSKSDVYSYGMMVLEMVGGRKNVNIRAEKTSEIYFPHWIYEHLDRDGDLQVCGVTNETEDIARKMILVGLWCIQLMPQSRPSISRVLEMLEGSIDGLQLPPKPSLSSQPRACGTPSTGST